MKKPKKFRGGWFWDELVAERGLDENGVLNPSDEEVRRLAAAKGFRLIRENKAKIGLAGADGRVYED